MNLLKKQIAHIDEVQKNRAVTLWLYGKDTLYIAEKLKVPEFFVYNSLPKWRGDDEVAA